MQGALTPYGSIHAGGKSAIRLHRGGVPGIRLGVTNFGDGEWIRG
jgi:hypothetical protein